MNRGSQLISKSMLICDYVLQDVRTGKKSLIGMFNKISSSQAPIRHSQLSIFVALTEGNGEYECELRCVNASTNKVIANLSGKLNCSNPCVIMEMSFDFNNVVFQEFGVYRFELLTAGEILNSCQFDVVQIEAKGK